MTTPMRKKISVKNVKLSEQPTGFKATGIYKGTVLGRPFSQVDQKTGEVMEKQLESVILEDDKGERTAYLADKGLLGALSESMVVENQKIEFVKLDKVALKGGRTMNQYDIFAIE